MARANRAPPPTRNNGQETTTPGEAGLTAHNRLEYCETVRDRKPTPKASVPRIGRRFLSSTFSNLPKLGFWDNLPRLAVAIAAFLGVAVTASEPQLPRATRARHQVEQRSRSDFTRPSIPAAVNPVRQLCANFPSQTPVSGWASSNASDNYFRGAQVNGQASDSSGRHRFVF